MGNPSDEKTVINVKGVSVSAWETAKRAANKQGQPMGVWLSRAAETLANLEQGPREFPPLAPANPGFSSANVPPRAAFASPSRDGHSPMSVEQLAAAMQSMAALSAATGIMPAKRNLHRAYNLLDDHVRQASGLAPRAVRLRGPGKVPGQSLLINGKASPANGGIHEDQRRT